MTQINAKSKNEEKKTLPGMDSLIYDIYAPKIQLQKEVYKHNSDSLHLVSLLE